MAKKSHRPNYPGLTPLLLFAITLFICIAGFSILSIKAPASPRTHAPTLYITVALGILAGAVYLGLLFYLLKKRPTVSITVMLLSAILLRLPLILAPPFLEDDYYRYLWDGAVTAHRMNPYTYAPAELLNKPPSTFPPRLQRLTQEGQSILVRINNPSVRTIYPPVAQFLFAIAALMKPWHPFPLRILYLLFEIGTAMLLRQLLRKLHRPDSWLLLYLWNPLLLFETYLRVHMDVFVFPFLLGALLLAHMRKPVSCAIVLALAVGVKIWPVLLVPLFITYAAPRLNHRIFALFIFLVVGLIVITPMVTPGLDNRAGVVAYGKTWENNDLIFHLVEHPLTVSLARLGLRPWRARQAVRTVIGGLITALAVVLSFRLPGSSKNLSDTHRDPHLLSIVVFRSVLLIATLFYLSPTQLPWYALWFLPFLCLVPFPSLYLAYPLLFLYNLGFLFESWNALDIFIATVPWIEHAPVLILMLFDPAIRHHRTIDPV